MKKTILAFTMLLSAGVSTMAQTQETQNSKPVQYHFFTNNIPSDWNYPLIGLVNNVDGNHASVQIGLVNSTTENFGGLQAGILNTVGGNVIGLQSGFINATGGDITGVSNGFINAIGGKVSGLQNGFINAVGQSVYGIQNGFVNAVGQSVFGIQNGFINSTGKEVIGIQSGFVNSASKINGLQYGFINSANTLRGLQLGFINSVDNVEKGLPIGFLSFVKNGGYKAIEVSYNTINPVNIAFKTGIREFYTYPMLAYDWRLDKDRLSFGYGVGSNIDLSKRLFINPELDWLHQISLDFNHYTTLRCNLGYSIGNIELVAGPSLVWQFKIDANDFHHNYTAWDPSIISVNKIKVGWNAAVRFKF